MLRVVNDCVLGHYEFPRVRRGVPRISVSVEARKIAAADFKAQAVSSPKYIRCRPHIDIEFVSLAGLQKFGRLLRIVIAGANDALGQILRKAVRAHVHQFGKEISFDCGRLGK